MGKINAATDTRSGSAGDEIQLTRTSAAPWVRLDVRPGSAGVAIEQLQERRGLVLAEQLQERRALGPARCQARQRR